MSRLSHRETFETLNALSRHQVLTPAQSRALQCAGERIAAEEGRKRPMGRRWGPREIEAVKAVMRMETRHGRPPRDEEIVGSLARRLDRSPEAIRQCMKRLRAVARGQARAPEYQLPLELRAE